MRPEGVVDDDCELVRPKNSLGEQADTREQQKSVKELLAGTQARTPKQTRRSLGRGHLTLASTAAAMNDKLGQVGDFVHRTLAALLDAKIVQLFISRLEYSMQLRTERPFAAKY